MRFSLRSGSVELALESLRFFNLDLAVFEILDPGYLAREASFKKEGLQIWSLGVLPAAIQIGEGHPLFDAPQVSLKDLENELLLEFPTKATSEGLRRAGILQVSDERFLITNHTPLRRQLVREGLAFAVSHLLPADTEVRDGVRYIPLEGLQYRICAAVNPRQPRLPEVERYLELLREELESVDVYADGKG